MVDLKQPFLMLAPMQEVTDLAFWRTLVQCGGGADLYVTEYFRVHIHSTLEKDILASVIKNPTGRPVLTQMIGQDPDEMVRTAKALLAYNEVAGVDINLGCPAPVVCSKNAGGGLLRDLDRIDELLARLREVCDQRWFTVKTRVGFEHEEEFERLLEVFGRHAIDLLVVHGRTVKERYQTPVHVGQVKLAVDRMSCPVVANGNVVNRESGLRYLQQTGAAGLMVGRGAIRNPWLFRQLREEGLVVKRKQLLEYIAILWDETASLRTELGQGFSETKHVQKMKRYLNYIVQGLEEELEYRMRRAKSRDELFGLLGEFLDSEDLVPDLPPERSKLFCGFSRLLS